MPDYTRLHQDLTAHIDAAITSGHEEGIQLAVYHGGHLIVDITRGSRDDAGTPLRPNDMTLVWSTSKGITATAMHILAERRLIEYDDAIADYWPAFAAHGKGNITIRHLMAHTAGVYEIPRDAAPDYTFMRDYDRICAIMADMHPIHPPAQQHIYHALTYGWPLAKVAEAVTNMPFGDLIQREICAPLGITDLFMGLPAHRANDVVRLTHDATPEQLANPDNPLPDPTVMANDPGILATCIPAANMVASARAVARVYASLIGNGVDGVRLLPPHRVANATRAQYWARTETPDRPEAGYALGWELGRANPLYGSRDTAFGHCGYGGPTGFADPEFDMAFALTKTRMNLAPDAPSLKRTLAHTVRAFLNEAHI
jgi:CubicO group peptidase (beta-lactamase class C family)